MNSLPYFGQTFKTLLTSQVTLYLGKTGLKVNMPFINLRTKILELKLVLLSKDKNDVKEHLAVFILLYPKPDLKSLVKNISTFFTFAVNGLICFLQQNCNHFL